MDIRENCPIDWCIAHDVPKAECDSATCAKFKAYNQGKSEAEIESARTLCDIAHHMLNSSREQQIYAGKLTKIAEAILRA